jgi:SAM-dependent methyltransferase
MSEHTGSSYDPISKKYADKLEDDDKAPYNAYYERPAVLSQLPPLEGLRVLDAGCGTGKLADIMVSQGASVTAFDYNADFVEWSRQRLGDRAVVLQADLAQPLSFAADKSFDLVTASLVLHYLKDWAPALRELQRVLAPGGLLVFSTHHPTMTWQLFKLEDYHAETLIEDEWAIGTVRYYHHSLDYISGALRDGGFIIEHLHEPLPTEDFRRVNPAGFEKVSKQPWFLVVRARSK